MLSKLILGELPPYLEIVTFQYLNTQEIQFFSLQWHRSRLLSAPVWQRDLQVRPRLAGKLEHIPDQV